MAYNASNGKSLHGLEPRTVHSLLMFFRNQSAAVVEHAENYGNGFAEFIDELLEDHALQLGMEPARYESAADAIKSYYDLAAEIRSLESPE